jgi:hypothetical protein
MKNWIGIGLILMSVASCTIIGTKSTSKSIVFKTEPIHLNDYQKQELLRRFAWKDSEKLINGDSLSREVRYVVLPWIALYDDTTLYEKSWKVRKDKEKQNYAQFKKLPERQLNADFYVMLRVVSLHFDYYKWFIIDKDDSVHFSSGFDSTLNDTNTLKGKVDIINALSRKYMAALDTAKFTELIDNFGRISLYEGLGYFTVLDYRKNIFRSKEEYESYNKIYYQNDSMKFKEIYGEATTYNPLTDYLLCEIEYAYYNDYFSVSYKRLKKMRQKDFYEK